MTRSNVWMNENPYSQWRLPICVGMNKHQTHNLKTWKVVIRAMKKKKICPVKYRVILVVQLLNCLWLCKPVNHNVPGFPIICDSGECKFINKDQWQWYSSKKHKGRKNRLHVAIQREAIPNQRKSWSRAHSLEFFNK